MISIQAGENYLKQSAPTLRTLQGPIAIATHNIVSTSVPWLKANPIVEIVLAAAFTNNLAAAFTDDNDGYCAGDDGFVKYHQARVPNRSRTSEL